MKQARPPNWKGERQKTTRCTFFSFSDGRIFGEENNSREGKGVCADVSQAEFGPASRRTIESGFRSVVCRLACVRYRLYYPRCGRRYRIISVGPRTRTQCAQPGLDVAARPLAKGVSVSVASCSRGGYCVVVWKGAPLWRPGPPSTLWKRQYF